MTARPLPARPPGIERGDHVYVRHAVRGPIAIKVLSHGRDGLVGECDQGRRHKVDWPDFLGTKARVLKRFSVVDQGADGAILEDERGARRYVEGELPGGEVAHTDAPHDAAAAPAGDDPLLDKGPLAKAMSDQDNQTGIILMAGRMVVLKAIKNAPGLALRDVTDKAGHRTKRWMKTAPDEKKQKPATMQHGQHVGFRHGDVAGTGHIVGSGADGVTIRDATGREHQVRHEHLTGPAPEPTKRNDKVDATVDPAAGQRAADAPLFTPAEVDSLPQAAVQPTKNKDELFAKSGQALDHLEEWLDRDKGICAKLGYKTMGESPDTVDWDSAGNGGMLFLAPLKGAARAAEKVRNDYGGDWSKLIDTVRCSIAVDSVEDLHKALGALKASPTFKLARQPKDRFAKPLPVGYRDMLLNVTFPNGIVGEVQLHVKPMLKAKAEGHHYYEIERTISAKPPDQLSDDDMAKLKDSVAKQTEIYQSAWAAASGGRGETPMRKAMAMSAAEYDYYEREGAYFRRNKSSPFRSVDDVLHGKTWKPYEGDRLQAGLMSDITTDPLAAGKMRKADAPVVLILKSGK